MLTARKVWMGVIITAAVLIQSTTSQSQTRPGNSRESACPSAMGGLWPERDILGFNLLTDLAGALTRLRCLGFSVRLTPRDGVSMPDGSRPVRFVVAQSGNQQIQLQAAGRVGTETVVGIQRYIEFPQGSEPLISDLQAQLEQKYPELRGQFRAIPRRGSSAGWLKSYEGDPRVMTRFQTCHNELAIWGATRLRFPAPECGHLIAADIVATDRNPQLAKSLSVQVSWGEEGRHQELNYEQWAAAAHARRQAEEVERSRGRRPVL